jgi:hypothetical protein
MLPTALKNSAPFAHSNDCRLYKADKSFMPEWQQDPQDTALWTRECGCHKDYYRAPLKDTRPPMPSAERHRHADVGGRPCNAVADVLWSDGWLSECRRCGTSQRYVPAGTPGFFPAPLPFDAEQINAVLRATHADPREREKQHILSVLGVTEEQLAAVLTAPKVGKKS